MQNNVCLNSTCMYLTTYLTVLLSFSSEFSRINLKQSLYQHACYIFRLILYASVNSKTVINRQKTPKTMASLTFDG